MTVTIRQAPKLVVASTDSVKELTVPILATHVELPQKLSTGVPRGRGYLRSKAPVIVKLKSQELTVKKLEQIKPKVYNVSVDNTFELPYYRCEFCKDTKRIMVFDECEHCEGTGCPKCRGTGTVKNHISCQLCAVKGVYK